MSSPESFDFEGFGESQFPPSEWLEYGLSDRFKGVVPDSEVGKLIFGLTKEYYTEVEPWIKNNRYFLKNNGQVVDLSVAECIYVEEDYTLLKKNQFETMHHDIRWFLLKGEDFETAVANTSQEQLQMVNKFNKFRLLSEPAKETLSDFIFTVGNLFFEEQDIHYLDILRN